MEYFREHPADLLVSVIPHFNRAICEAWTSVYPERPFVTIITDLADFPPRFWIEPMRDQYVICGTDKAVQQARAMGKGRIAHFCHFRNDLKARFLCRRQHDPVALRKELGLHPDLPTGILLFGGFGSRVMYDIAEASGSRAVASPIDRDLRQKRKAQGKFRARRWNLPLHVLGFTKEVHRLMRAADFLIGKPGPGSIAEAMVGRLPVIVECNSWTLPQERYNTEWVKEKRVGIVLKNFREIVQGVNQLLEPATLAEFRRNVAALNNRAVFEIPEILSKLLAGDKISDQLSGIRKQ